MASPRQLAYQDRFVWLLEQTVSAQWDDCDDFADRFVFPDMTTRVPLVIHLSQEEFTTLYSAVLTGADLSYPNTSHDVEYLLLQSVICPMNQFCAAMIDCLLNDPDTLAALLQALADAGYTGGQGDPTQPLDAGILGGNLLPSGYLCTDDKAFGMALAIVNSLNEATTEVLQAIEVLTNPLELAAEIGDNMPGVGILSNVGDVARWIQNTAKEQYDLAWSATIRDELACEIWCLIKDGCSLSYDDIWGMYLANAEASPPAGVLLTDWLAWLVLLAFTGAKQTVSAVSLLGLLAMRYGGSFGEFQLGIRSIETVTNLAQDDTSPDWSTLCDACPTFWCYQWLNGSVLGMIALAAFGCTAVISATEVTGCTNTPNTGQHVAIEIHFVQPADITRVRFTTDLNPTRGTGSTARVWFDAVEVFFSGSPQIGEIEHDFSGSWTGVEVVRIDCSAASFLTGTSPDGDGAYSYLREVIIDGGGNNPMGSDNC